MIIHTVQFVFVEYSIFLILPLIVVKIRCYLELFITKMDNNIKRPLFKYAVLFFFGIIGFVVVVNAAITIPSNISNAIQVIQRLLITDDGTQS